MDTDKTEKSGKKVPEKQGDTTPATGTTGKEQVEPQERPRRDPKHLIFPLLALIGLGSAGAALYILLTSMPEDRCYKVLQYMETGEATDVSISPVTMHECRMKSCTFDLTFCGGRCPFAYETDDAGCPKSCACASEGIYQGDIQYSKHQISDMLQAYGYDSKKGFSLFFARKGKIWDEIRVDGRVKVPFKMSKTPLDKSVAKVWNEVTAELAAETCIDFIDWTSERYHLEVTQGDMCSSSVGRQSEVQSIQLASACASRGHVWHEFIHTLGFDHEHTRPDRDAHINVLKQNIIPEALKDFKKMIDSQLTNIGSEYDQESIMHFRSKQFSKDGQPTITFKPEDEPKYESPDMSVTEEDITEINFLYKCFMDSAEGDVTASWSEWSEWSECSSTCSPGSLMRFRDCIVPDGDKTSSCEGEPVEYKNCNMDSECPKSDGEYEPWGEWEECDKTCGMGFRRRYRKCDEEKNKNGCYSYMGEYHNSEEWACRLDGCDGAPNPPIDIKWYDEWISARNCNATCGGGFEEMHLHCGCDGDACGLYNCDPTYGDLPAHHDRNTNFLIKHEACNTEVCEDNATTTKAGVSSPAPVPATTATTTTATTTTPTPTTAFAGIWSEWGPYGGCDRLCEGGNKVRKRECLSDLCIGDFFNITACNEGPCGKRNETERELEPGFVPRKINFKVSDTIPSMCANGKLMTGRFNNDVFHDFLCLGFDGVIQIYLSKGNGKFSKEADWKGRTDMCASEKDCTVYAKDLNGDHLTDLICRNKITKELEVLINEDGSFPENVNWKGARNLCVEPDEILNVYDLNGDRRADLMCGDKNNAFQKIVLHINNDT